MNYSAGGSPLLARSNGSIYNVIIIAFIIIGLLTLIYFLFKKIKKSHETTEWLEAEKNRVTKPADVKRLCSENNFSKHEQELLWEMCRVCEFPNIYYNFHSMDKISDLFFKYYNILKEKGFTEDKLFDFFMLRGKMEKARSHTAKLSSTKNILEETTIFYINKEREQFPFTLVKNDKNFLKLEIPGFFENYPHKPKELERILFTFKSSVGMTYNFVSRVIRYEKNEDKLYMYIAHSHNLNTQAHRQYQREFINDSCTFSSVSVINQKKENVYVTSPKKFPAQLKNISAGGCCIHTKLPIKENQLICIFFPSLGINEMTIGQIRHTRKAGDGIYALHIQFIKINKSVMNQIFAFVYKFEL